MAKLSAINKNNRRIKLTNKFFKKRQSLKKIIKMIKILTYKMQIKLNLQGNYVRKSNL